MRIVQISDTHISHFGGVTSENFELLVDFVNTELRPDLIVNTGDVSILTPDIAEDRVLAAKLHERFDAPVQVLPGNHDLGEANDHPWMGIAVTSERLAGFVETFGSDHFVNLDTERWAIVGMNSEILNSGLPEEAAQWAWLEEVADSSVGRSVLLFLHKPLWSPIPGYTEHALAIEESDRDRILEIFARSTLRAVGSGHLHCYATAKQGDVLTVWAPSSAFVVKSAGWNLGLNQLGVVEYRIEGNEIEAYFRATPSFTEAEPFTMPAFAETMALIEGGTAALAEMAQLAGADHSA
jgi:3',5'-cyclic AMP phosphodiesterase CpdA